MQSEMSWHRPRGSLVCLVLALCAASTEATLREPAANLTSDKTTPLWEPAASLTSDVIYRDCSDLPSYSPSGVYTLRPGLVALDVPAYCDMDNDGGGWTVVIRRDGIEPRENFYRDWDTYKWGLGIVDEEFYWGNEYLWLLTSQHDRRYQVHFWLEDFDGNTRYALYQNFLVESEAAYYRLQVGEYSGDAGDSLSYNNNQNFSTFDSDNDEYSVNCADSSHGEAGWWYVSCTLCQLTGRYYDGGNSGDYLHGITWEKWKSADPYSLKAAVMKIKPSKKL